MPPAHQKSRPRSKPFWTDTRTDRPLEQGCPPVSKRLDSWAQRLISHWVAQVFGNTSDGRRERNTH
jgi:hypothetical protein